MKARDNPFRVARVLSAIRYEIPADGDSKGRDAGVLLPRLEALRFRAAIVGPHGSGKTTLLEDLEGVLAARGFRIIHVRLDTSDPHLPREWRRRWRWPSRTRSSAQTRVLHASDIICLDGAEQLGRIAWLRFRWRVRNAGGLIITTHARGRLPTLIECATSVGLLQRIMQRLAPDALATAPSANDLFTRHHGNIREALRELYDVYASASAV